MIILDTNVISELMRPEPSSRVLNWLGGTPDSEVYTTAISQAEIVYGFALLPIGRRRSDLEAAGSRLFTEKLAGRVLPFDSAAAAHFAALAASRRKRGKPVSASDAMIASVARARDADIATRNIADFSAMGIRLVDPWS